jgi:O-antigen/teichoic acid export membrane protein
MGVKKDFLKDSIIFGLGDGIKKFIGLFLLPFYTRALSPAEYGILASVSTFAMLFSAFLNVGLDSASGFFFFQAKTEKEKGEVLFSHLMLRIISVIPPIILSFFSTNISLLLFKSNQYTWIVFVSIIAIPVDLLMSEQAHIFRYFRKPWSYNIVTITKSIVNIGIGISLVVILKWGIIGAQLASIVSSSFVVLGSFLLFTRKVYSYSFSWHWTRKMLGFGFPLLWASLAGWVYDSSDRFFLLHYSNLTEIGYYSIGTTFSQPIQLINMAVQMSFGVLFFQTYYDEKNTEKPISKKMAVESFNLYFGVTVLSATFLSIFGIDIINLFASKNYNQGALSIPFLTFAFIAAQSFQLMGPGIQISEKTWHFTWITIMTALINICLNFLLIPHWGFVGAAASTLLSYIVYWFTKTGIAQKYFKIDYPLIKIIAFFSLSFFISTAIVFAGFKLHYEIRFWLKCTALCLISGMAFYFNFLPITIFAQIKHSFQK